MINTNPIFDDQAIVPPDEGYCRRMLDPWVVDSLPVSSDRGKAIIKTETDKFRSKVRRKSLKSVLSIGRPFRSLRTSEYVKSEYERIWSSREWPSTDAPLDGYEPTYVTWQDELLIVRRGGTNQMELDRICAAIEHAQPASVLEIGFGTGRNLLSLSVMYPDVRFAGYELSTAGVSIARSVQAAPVLPDVLARFCPRSVVDATAHTRIEFNQGDASALPVRDKTFDMIFTRLALEQMEIVKEDVLREIGRVTRNAAVLVEPFNDSNQSELQKLSKKAKNHFSLHFAELANYGLAPVAYFDNWPHKLKEGVGLAVAHPM